MSKDYVVQIVDKQTGELVYLKDIEHKEIAPLVQRIEKGKRTPA